MMQGDYSWLSPDLFLGYHQDHIYVAMLQYEGSATINFPDCQ